MNSPMPSTAAGKLLIAVLFSSALGACGEPSGFDPLETGDKGDIAADTGDPVLDNQCSELRSVWWGDQQFSDQVEVTIQPGDPEHITYSGKGFTFAATQWDQQLSVAIQHQTSYTVYQVFALYVRPTVGAPWTRVVLPGTDGKILDGFRSIRIGPTGLFYEAVPTRDCTTADIWNGTGEQFDYFADLDAFAALLPANQDQASRQEQLEAILSSATWAVFPLVVWDVGVGFERNFDSGSQAYVLYTTCPNCQVSSAGHTSSCDLPIDL